jgi:hypothetical protein
MDPGRQLKTFIVGALDQGRIRPEFLSGGSARRAEPQIEFAGPKGKDRQHMGQQIVIASRLSDGIVVFLSKASAGSVEWAMHLEAAEVAADEARAAELLGLGEADVTARNEVVDPYLIDVEEQNGQLWPTKYREVIRCLGPTIRKDLGKQAEGPEA